jgi:mannose-6-phosphate isomerase-like protein (cupin superfamily)
MADYTLVNLKTDVEDQAPKFGLSPGLQSHFARRALGLEKTGMSHYRLAPNFRTPFGHTHSEQEEIYVVVDGTARWKIEDEIVELAQWDALRVPPGVMRCMEGGPEGAEVIAFGGPTRPDGNDAELVQDWWHD